MANNPGNGEGAPNTGLAIALMIALFFILWFVFHNTFATIFLTIGQGLFQPLKWTVGWFSPEFFYGVEDQFRVAMKNVAKVDLSMLIDLSAWMGGYYRFPLVLMMGWLAWQAWRHPIIHLNTLHSFESLIRYQSEVWKPIVPVLNLDLHKDTSEAWASSLRCVDIAEREHLIHAGVLKLEEAWEFLVRQLGPKFVLSKLENHERALFTVFAMRICRKRKEAAAMLDALNESCRKTGRPDYSLVAQEFEQYRRNKKVLAAIRGYAYTRTVLFQMLVMSRSFDGKLPTSHFLWLKPLDRPLWYALDRAPVDLGRIQVAAFAEGVAVASQWQAETLANENRMRMGIERKDPESGAVYLVSIPYLVVALTAFAIDLEDCGLIRFPAAIAPRLQKESNERRRFNIIQYEYIMAGLTGYFEKKDIEAREAARHKLASKVKKENHVAV